MESGVAERHHDRRRTRRHRTTDEHGIAAARVRPGYDVVVIDICADGVLVETTYRLLPGTSVDLQLDLFTHRVLARGRVLRCAVAAVHPWAVIYRAAILFERSLSWLQPSGENVVPGETESAWAEATRRGE